MITTKELALLRLTIIEDGDALGSCEQCEKPFDYGDTIVEMEGMSDFCSTACALTWLRKE